MSIFDDLTDKLKEKAASLNISASTVVEQFIRGSGKGGQKVNKTSSTVQLKHIPTGIEIRCQKHREQSKNRTSALKILISKVEHLKLGKESQISKKIYKLKKQKQKRSKRSQQKILDQKSLRGDLKTARKKIL